MQATNFKNSAFELNPSLVLCMQLNTVVSVTSIENIEGTFRLIHDNSSSSSQLKLDELLKMINPTSQKNKIVIIDENNNVHATFGYYLRGNQIIIK